MSEPAPEWLAPETLAEALSLKAEYGEEATVVMTTAKDDPALGKQKTVTLPKWTPLDPKKPQRMMIFFDAGMNDRSPRAAWAIL